MQWQEIRIHYPGQWLLIEAIKAHTEGNQRILDELTVINAFPDARTAMDGYAQLHREAPQRELYVLHTDRKRSISPSANGWGCGAGEWKYIWKTVCLYFRCKFITGKNKFH